MKHFRRLILKQPTWLMLEMKQHAHFMFFAIVSEASKIANSSIKPKTIQLKMFAT
jgi:hypothetical protein